LQCEMQWCITMLALGIPSQAIIQAVQVNISLTEKIY